MIPQPFYPNEPELKDLLDLFRKDILLQFNCHHLGTVQAFDPVQQTAQVTINYQKTFFRPNSAGIYGPVLESYPVIAEAPVIFPGGGTGVLTFPVNAGDECLVLFNDRDIDNWYNGSSNSAVNTGRLHSFSDALVLIGPRSMANAIEDFNADDAEFRTLDGNAKVAVGASSVLLTYGTNTIEMNSTEVTITLGTTVLTVNNAGQFSIQNATGEFVAALVQLFTDISTGAVASGGGPLVMPTFIADLAKLETFL